jgi:2-succinyl-6-hydroxy-2,4-cyclohexadiene-1-carboxylate synthase
VSAALLLHGFTGSPDSWRYVRERLPKNVEITAPLLTGHGNPPVALGVDSFDGELARLLDLATEGSLLVGYSLGARLALGLALRAPERFRGVVLISGSAGVTDESERQPRRERDGDLCRMLQERGLEAFVEHWEREPLFAPQALLPQWLRQEERARRLAHTAEGLCHSLRTTGLAEMPSYWSKLGALELSVELVVGDLDLRFCATAAAMAGELPRAHRTTVADAGHNLLIERPLAVKDAIVRGLAA